ncbi:MAG TPA: DUF4307 domain-containing protein [Mycobacterium sp.]|nr:DUF4307 domain-containing protein [Mycobacterium sp.]
MTDPANDKAVRRPVNRYGRVRLPARPRRRAVITMAALAIAAGVIVAVIAYQRLGTPDVRGDLFGYQLIDDETASVTISVTRSDPSRPVVCIVRVRAADGSETGRREVLVGPSEAATVQVTAIVKSSKPPVMGDVYGCGTDVPGYLRSR